MDNVIAPHPPNDGREWDCQCARCGSTIATDDCPVCAGLGIVDLDREVEFDNMPADECNTCDGHGHLLSCISGGEWCQAHPLPGRSETPRGAIEWFVIGGTP